MAPADVTLFFVSGEKPIVFTSGPFSNFAESSISARAPGGEIVTYRTVEHYFQAWKTLTPHLHLEVAEAEHPKRAKALGRQLDLRPDWEDVKQEVMLEALRLKFTLDEFRTKLLRTGKRQIIEESQHDLEWGARRTSIGWEGENRLGTLLMVVRDEIRAAEPTQLELGI